MVSLDSTSSVMVLPAGQRCEGARKQEAVSRGGRREGRHNRPAGQELRTFDVLKALCASYRAGQGKTGRQGAAPRPGRPQSGAAALPVRVLTKICMAQFDDETAGLTEGPRRQRGRRALPSGLWRGCGSCRPTVSRLQVDWAVQ